MAVEKDKVLAKLEAKFKGKSLTKNFKDSIATKWAAKIDTDDDIDSYIEDREDVILEASTEADRRATQATAKAKADAAAAVAGKNTDTDPKEGADELPPDTPPYVKAIMAQMKAMSDKVEGFERSKQVESLTERFKKAAKEKNIPDVLLKGRIPTKDEDFESALAELETDFKPLAEQWKLAGFGNDAPAGGGGGTPPTKGKVDPAVAAFAESQVKSFETKQKN